MPNWMVTRCTVTGPADTVAAFKKKVFRETVDERGRPVTEFDFHQIIPRPNILDETEEAAESKAAQLGQILLLLRSGITLNSLGLSDKIVEEIRADVGMPGQIFMNELAEAFLAKHPKTEQAGHLRLKVITETGYANKDSWNSVNWGTNRESYSFRLVGEDPLDFIFYTAWSFPEPIFRALANEFPELHFKCISIEEGMDIGAVGYFNPPAGEQAFGYCDFSEELYERVWGEKYPRPLGEEENAPDIATLPEGSQ